MKKTFLMALVLAATLAGCGRKEEPQQQVQQPQYQQQVQPQAPQPQYAPQAPIIVQAAPAPVQSGNDNMMRDMLLGGMIGHAIGGGGSRSAAQAPVINKTVVNKTYITQPAPVPVRPTYSSPARVPSFSTPSRSSSFSSSRSGRR